MRHWVADRDDDLETGEEVRDDSKRVGTYSSRIEAELARTRLESVGISAQVVSDDVGGAYPVLEGHGVALWVTSGELERAKQILSTPPAQLEEAPGSLEDAERLVSFSDSENPTASALWIGLSFFLVGTIFGFALVALKGDAPGSFSPSIHGTQEVDRNLDGKTDTWHDYVGDLYVESRIDRNLDGEPDEWHRYQGQETTESIYDDSFDGKPDMWVDYVEGTIKEMRLDFDGNGIHDYTTQYKFGVPVLSKLEPNGGPKEQEERYKNGRLHEVYSTSQTGQPVLVRRYDSLGRETSFAH